MASVEKKLGTETIHVLNDKYQFVSAQQAVNAKWLDLDNVVSVKRDKTIYAIRARTNYDFDNQDQNCEFFCNLNGSNGIANPEKLYNSNIFRNFDANTNIFDRNDYKVYGNANINANLENLGWAGSLDTQFVYEMRLTGNINVSSNVSIFSNLKQADYMTPVPEYLRGNLAGALYLNGNVKNWKLTATTTDIEDGYAVISNAYSTNKLFLSNAAQTKWNRLINANVNANVIVTASTDPCDIFGNANNRDVTIVAGNAETNEVYRHQFAIKRNTETVSNENPIYIGRISRFGTSLKDVTGTMSSVMAIDSFTSNFFANLPSDNLIYYNKNTPLTEMSITGSYKSTSVIPFSSNYLDSNIGNMSGNLLSTNTAFSSIVTLGKYDTIYSDYITNPNLTLENLVPGELKKHDRFTVIQSNLAMSNPLYLFDRLQVENEKYKPASQIFAASSSNEVSDIANHTIDLTPAKYAATAAMVNSGTTTPVIDSKVVHLSLYNIVANNWQSTLEISPNLITPELTGTPTMTEYTSGNTIQLYLRRGFVSLDNYSQVNSTVPTTGSRYFSTIPSFLKSYSEPTDGIYIEDKTVIHSTQSNLGLSCNITTTYDVSDTLSITANISPDLCFYVFANADINNRVDRRANVVIPVEKTVISNIWTYSNLNIKRVSPDASSVTFDPKIVYNNFDGLSVENPFAKKNITYTVKFGKVLGETNLEQEKASNTLYGFNANLTAKGNVASSVIPNTDLSEYKLLDNQHLNGLLLNGVAYSEYEFTDFSYKFTDLGNVMSLDSSNYRYNSVLPIVGNAAFSASVPGAMLGNVKDNYMNVLVDYAGLNIEGNDTDVHRLAIFDNHYRYYINSVQKTGGGPINITTMYNNDASEDVLSLVPTLGVIGASPDITAQNICPSTFLVYTYEKIYENSSNDNFFPFTTPNFPWSERVNSKVESDNYLFPGFVYKHSGEEIEFYNYKDETSCDFVINNNIKEFEQSLSLVVFSADTETKTLKVGLSTENSTKSINVRPIRLGGADAVNNRQWYTPVVFKIAAESNSYVVLLIRISVSSTEVFLGLHSSCANFTPLAVNINSIEKASDGSNQIQFKSKLTVYSQHATNNTLQSQYTNIVNSHKTKLSNFSYSSEYGSSNTNVGVNLYSIPVNNIVILFAYKKNVIKKVMNYIQSDYELDNSVNYDNSSEASRYKKINRPVSTLNFASSYENTGADPLEDGVNPYIPINTTRFYLDQGYKGAVYVDYQNNSVISLKNMSKLQLSRSVEWILTRQEEGSNLVETVGRGVLSRNPGSAMSNKKDFIIGENLGKAASGFYMNVNTNIVDMASHLILQKKQTGALKMNTPPQFKLKTKSDAISVSLFHENPSTLAKTFIDNKIAESRTVDLGRLFALDPGIYNKISNLPSFEFDLVRSLSSTNVNYKNVSDALFRVKIRLDNYCIVHNKKAVNGGNVLFSSLTNVDTLTLGLKMATNLKRTINHDFMNISSSFGQEHKIIKSFVHKGFGKVDMRVYDFTSHYDNELPSQELTDKVLPFNFPTSAAYTFSVPSSWVSTTKEIEYETDTAISKYYVNLGTKDLPDKLYFKGTLLSSQPLKLNDVETFLLYTGTRPIGFITYEMLADSTLHTFTDRLPATFASNSSVFNSLITANSNVVKAAFKSGNTDSSNANTPYTPTDSTHPYKMYYSVALTNRSSDKSIKVRGVSYKFKNDEIFKVTQPLTILFGVLRSLSGLLENMQFNYKFGAIEGAYKLATLYSGSNYLTSNFEEKSDKYLTYTVKTAAEGNLFKLKFHGSVSDSTYFKVAVNPSKLEIYQAMDVNDNGALDNNQSVVADSNNTSAGTGANSVQNLTQSFGLQATFSELLYNLRSNPSNKTQYRQPSIIQTIDLNHGWNSIVGSGLDIKLNNKWSMGYNLDCFFTIRNNNICTFDVISIDTDTQNTSAEAASLKVQNSLPLIVGNKNSWARSKGYTDDSNDHCGLTFKLREGQSIKGGEIVRLFVDNTPTSNTLQVNVNVAGKESKSYKLSDYDNETYSRLLDKQIKLKNKFE